MTKRLAGPALVTYLRQFPSSDDRGWAADELESMQRIIAHQAQLNEAAHEQIRVLRAAVTRQVANIERWQETGVPARPEESKEIYEQLKTALEA